jgi:hypothetical protein
LADGFAQLQKQEKRKNKKIATNPEQGELAPNEPVPVPQISNLKQKIAQNLSTFPSEPLTTAVTSAPAVTSAATFSEKIGFKAMNLLATGFQKISTTTPLTLSTSTVTSVAATRSGMTMVTAATLPPVVTLTTATTVTTSMASRPTTRQQTESPSNPQFWKEKPLPDLPKLPKTGPPVKPPFTKPFVEDLGSDRGADLN